MFVCEPSVCPVVSVGQSSFGALVLGKLTDSPTKIKKSLAYQADKVSECFTLSVQSWIFFNRKVIIMGYRFVKYMKLSPNELHNALVERGLSPPEIQEIKGIMTEQKEHKRSQGAHKKQMDLLWGELVAPLTHERKTVKSIMRYKGSPERAEALEAYLLVLDKLIERLYLLMRDKDKTPAQLYPERTHWSDYVPQRIRDEVCDMFAAIPYKAKAKVKAPFARTVPAILHNKQRTRLERRTV
jgi:hypothetical protein